MTRPILDVVHIAKVTVSVLGMKALAASTGGAAAMQPLDREVVRIEVTTPFDGVVSVPFVLAIAGRHTTPEALSRPMAAGC